MRKEAGRKVWRAGRGLGALAALALWAGPANAQEPSERGRWLPWLGCWQAVGEGAQALGEGMAALCVSERDGASGVELLTVVNGEVSSRRVLMADGEQRAVEQAGCTGWERARWSGDGQRVYLRSELSCEGGTRRITSGVLSMATPTEWLDLQSVEAGGYPVVRMRRYRPAPESVARQAGVRSPEGVALALETARTAAAQPLSVEDVAEASRELGSQTLEMLLYERGGLFEVDAEALLALDEAGVDPKVIDLVVALAYPDVFGVNAAARTVGVLPDEPTAAELASARAPRVYGTFYDPWGPFGYGSGYGYGSRWGSYYSPFGWGNPYGWRYTGGGPVIIIQPPDDVGGGRGPVRYVKGRGYTRASSSDAGATRSSPPRGSSTVGRTGSSTSSGSATTTGSSGSSGSSGSTGRTAKPRTGGGGG